MGSQCVPGSQKEREREPGYEAMLEYDNCIVLFTTVVQRARAEAMGVGLKHSTNNRSYVNC